jgi:hypothetical protein
MSSASDFLIERCMLTKAMEDPCSRDKSGRGWINAESLIYTLEDTV